jgi:hypothetical protein
MAGDESGRSNGGGNKTSVQKDGNNGRYERPVDDDKERGGRAAGRSDEADAVLRNSASGEFSAHCSIYI